MKTHENNNTVNKTTGSINYRNPIKTQQFISRSIRTMQIVDDNISKFQHLNTLTH